MLDESIERAKLSARQWDTNLQDVETKLLKERGRRPNDRAQAK